MSRDEFWLGVCVYSAIIAASFSGPMLKKLKNTPLEEPIAVWAQSYFYTQKSSSNFSKPVDSTGVLNTNRSTQKLLIPAIPPSSISQIRVENWKKLASHPSTPASNSKLLNTSPVLGSKPDLKNDFLDGAKKPEESKEPEKS